MERMAIFSFVVPPGRSSSWTSQQLRGFAAARSAIYSRGKSQKRTANDPPGRELPGPQFADEHGQVLAAALSGGNLPPKRSCLQFVDRPGSEWDLPRDEPIEDHTKRPAVAGMSTAADPTLHQTSVTQIPETRLSTHDHFKFREDGRF
jgi:hypothetical protein